VKVVLVALLGVFLLVADPPGESPGRAANAGMTNLSSPGDPAQRDGTDGCPTGEAADSTPAGTLGILALVASADRGGASGTTDRRCSDDAGAGRDGDR
jgi:hypothetical protein